MLSQTVGSGETVTLSVAAFSTRPLTYVWLENCEVIVGATNATLVVTNMQSGRVGRYKVFVSSGAQAVESASAFLEMNFSGDAGSVQKVASRDKLADRVIIAGNLGGAANSAPSRGISLKSQIANRKSQMENLAKLGLTEIEPLGFGGAPARGFVGTQIFHTFGNTKEIGEPNHAETGQKRVSS